MEDDVVEGAGLDRLRVLKVGLDERRVLQPGLGSQLLPATDRGPAQVNAEETRARERLRRREEVRAVAASELQVAAGGRGCRLEPVEAGDGAKP